jgi:hypothetical protein
MKQKRDNGKLQPIWLCSICCNPSNGRRYFEDGRLIKSSFIALGEAEFALTMFDSILN